MNDRLKLAAMLAGAIDPPHGYMGEQETKESYNNWAMKLLKMADALIDKEKNTDRDEKTDVLAYRA